VARIARFVVPGLPITGARCPAQAPVLRRGR